MGKRRTTIRVKRLGSYRSKRGKAKERRWAVYVNAPGGIEYRISNSDCKSKKKAVAMAAKIRKARFKR